MNEKWNDRLEIEGDAREEVILFLEAEKDLEAHYLDWCERQNAEYMKDKVFADLIDA